jgi:selenocysteine lyase/cysteine desulfurase
MLDCQRHLFSLPDNIHYLNCAYMSPLLKSVEEAGMNGIVKKRLPNSIGYDDFFTLPKETRALFAKLVNAPSAQDVTLLPSVSYGMAIVAKNCELKRGQNIVSVAGEFPSNVYAWKKLLTNDVELRLVKPPTEWGQVSTDYGIANAEILEHSSVTRGELWNERILEAIDENTALVILCPVHWADGTLFDLEVIGDAARSVGAIFVIDGTQAIGAMPFDVQRIKPDALIAASYKCMMGAYSIGCAYWGERFSHGEPLEETWIGRVGSDDFRNLVNYRNEYQQGMERYNMGEQSNFTLLPMLHAAITQLLQWHPENVQEYCRALTQPLIQYCAEADFWIEESHWRTEHLFGIRIPSNLSIDVLQQALSKRNVFVSLRGDSIRVSPSVYNTQDDIAALIETLTDTLNH